MKRILSLTVAILLFLTGFSAFGDVVFAPPSNFYETHQKECTVLERNYYSNGEKGYISLHKAPESPICGYLTNGIKLRIFCTYEGWGMISYVDGTMQKEGKWVKMSDLYLIYDEQSFREEFAEQITQGDPLTLPEGISSFYAYTYPGAREPSSYSIEAPDLQTTTRYTDSEGRIWGRIAYYKGIRNQWICFSDPTALIPPFGATDLVYIEKADPPSPQEDETMDEPVSDVVDPDEIPGEIPPYTEDNGPEIHYGEDQPEVETDPLFAPEDPPKKPPMDPLLLVAVCLVAAAVIAAVVLIIICYKKEK